MQTEEDTWLLEFVDAVEDFTIIEALLSPNFVPLIESNFSIEDAITITLNEDIAWDLRSVVPQGPKAPKGTTQRLKKDAYTRSLPNYSKSLDAHRERLDRFIQKKNPDLISTGKKFVTGLQKAVDTNRGGRTGQFLGKEKKQQYQNLAHQIVADRLSAKFGKSITTNQVRDLAKATNALKARGYDPQQAAKMAMNKLKTTGKQMYAPSELNRSKVSRQAAEKQTLATPTTMTPAKKPSLLSRALSAFRGGKAADASYTSKPIPGTLGVKGGPSYTAVPNPTQPVHTRPVAPQPSSNTIRRSPDRMRTPGSMRRPIRRPM